MEFDDNYMDNNAIQLIRDYEARIKELKQINWELQTKAQGAGMMEIMLTEKYRSACEDLAQANKELSVHHEYRKELRYAFMRDDETISTLKVELEEATKANYARHDYINDLCRDNQRLISLVERLKNRGFWQKLRELFS